MKIHAKKVVDVAKEAEAENGDSAVQQESEAQKVLPPVSEAAQAAVDGLLLRSSTT